MLELKDYFDAESAGQIVEVGADALIAGFLAAFISGLIACTWMIKLVKNAKLDYFAIYCVIVGLIAIAYDLEDTNGTEIYGTTYHTIHNIPGDPQPRTSSS